MQASGIRIDQITQVRGFADQHLRKPEAPLDPANRRISLIVQYIVKNSGDGEGAGNDEKSPPVTKPLPGAPKT
jgi:chemotaxis protein MotB